MFDGVFETFFPGPQAATALVLPLALGLGFVSGAQLDPGMGGSRQVAWQLDHFCSLESLASHTLCKA